MILQVNNKKIENANSIWLLFQDSYTIEANILNIEKHLFPPLNRSITDISESNTNFYGIYDNEILKCIIEIKDNVNSLHIQSLVVASDYFRQGMASKLISFVLQKNLYKETTVETGLKNIPAVKLYESFGFKKVKEWLTDHNVIKIRLSLKN